MFFIKNNRQITLWKKVVRNFELLLFSFIKIAHNKKSTHLVTLVRDSLGNPGATFAVEVQGPGKCRRQRLLRILAAEGRHRRRLQSAKAPKPLKTKL
jgi:hypothetical protein